VLLTDSSDVVHGVGAWRKDENDGVDVERLLVDLLVVDGRGLDVVLIPVKEIDNEVSDPVQDTVRAEHSEEEQQLKLSECQIARKLLRVFWVRQIVPLLPVRFLNLQVVDYLLVDLADPW